MQTEKRGDAAEATQLNSTQLIDCSLVPGAVGDRPAGRRDRIGSSVRLSTILTHQLAGNFDDLIGVIGVGPVILQADGDWPITTSALLRRFYHSTLQLIKVVWHIFIHPVRGAESSNTQLISSATQTTIVSNDEITFMSFHNHRVVLGSREWGCLPADCHVYQPSLS